MIYECEQCGTALPPGATACPDCGDTFAEAVPQDAEIPSRGWQARVGQDGTSSAKAKQNVSSSSSADPVEPQADRESSSASVQHYWRGKVQPVVRVLKRNIVEWIVGVVGIIAFGAVIYFHSTAYVIASHPHYAENMEAFQRLLQSGSVRSEWPADGQEDKLTVIIAGEAYASPAMILDGGAGGINNVAATLWERFSGIRYASGFTQQQAVDCTVQIEDTDRKVLLSFDGASAAHQ